MLQDRNQIQERPTGLSAGGAFLCVEAWPIAPSLPLGRRLGVHTPQNVSWVRVLAPFDPLSGLMVPFDFCSGPFCSAYLLTISEGEQF
jgi:hypothetical protein